MNISKKFKIIYLIFFDDADTIYLPSLNACDEQITTMRLLIENDANAIFLFKYEKIEPFCVISNNNNNYIFLGILVFLLKISNHRMHLYQHVQ